MSESNPSEIIRAHIWVSGRVQGVGFRAFVQQSAVMFGLAGWVRNLPDDQVETIAEGTREVVERFVEVVKTGPRAARVDVARVDWETPQGEHGFHVRF